MPAHRLFFQRLGPHKLIETRVRGDQLEKSELGTPKAYLAPPTQLSARLATLFGKLVRLFGHGLWLSPLLILPKAVLRFVDSLLSDVLLLVFVGIVVGFFASLVGLVLMRLIGGTRDELVFDVVPPELAAGVKAPRTLLLPKSDSAAQLRHLVGSRVRVRGHLVGNESGAEPGLMHDLWLTETGKAERVVWSVPWTLEADGVLVVADLDAAPELHAPTRKVGAQEWFDRLVTNHASSLDASAKWRTPGTDAQLSTLNNGDRVELRGVIAQVSEEAQQEEDGVGYRKRGMSLRPVVKIEASLNSTVHIDKL